MIHGNPQNEICFATIQKGSEAILEHLRGKHESLKKTVPIENQPPANNIFDSVVVGAKRQLEAEAEDASVSRKVEAANLRTLELDARIRQYEAQLDDCSLSRAKRYALKKELAKTRSLIFFQGAIQR